MKLTQYAVHSTGPEMDNQIKAWLGLQNKEWIIDEVTAEVIVNGKSGINRALLQFCHAYDPVQFEIIRYLEGPNWLQEHPVVLPYTAHIGYHLDEGEDWPRMESCPLVQEAVTKLHTAPHLVHSGKRYHYRIHRAGPMMYWKFIRRIML